MLWLICSLRPEAGPEKEKHEIADVHRMRQESNFAHVQYKKHCQCMQETCAGNRRHYTNELKGPELRHYYAMQSHARHPLDTGAHLLLGHACHMDRHPAHWPVPSNGQKSQPNIQQRSYTQDAHNSGVSLLIQCLSSERPQNMCCPQNVFSHNISRMHKASHSHRSGLTPRYVDASTEIYPSSACGHNAPGSNLNW